MRVEAGEVMKFTLTDMLLKRVGEESWRVFGKRIKFYAPSFIHYKTPYLSSNPTSFPAISITGGLCSLRCKHCEGRILESMTSAKTPIELLDLCLKLKRAGSKGCLITGGCLPNGSIPLRKFTSVIKKIVEELGLEVVIHTGLLNHELAEELSEAGVSAALIDVVGSNETIREVLHLPTKRVSDYEESLKALREAGVPVIPHVVVGLHYGKLLGEFNALKIISRYDPAAVIIIVFTPIVGTPMEGVKPPDPEGVIEVIAYARKLMKRKPIALGCMKPGGEYRVKLEELAVKAGVNAVAFPSFETIQLAESIGLETSFSRECCSLIFKDSPLPQVQ